MDLKTKYMGMELASPLVASASPLSKSLDGIKKMEDSGASAIVLYSLFEEQISHESMELDHYLDRDAEGYAEATSFFPDLENYNLGPDGYLDHIRKAKDALEIPVIASLNGITFGGWVDYAKRMQDAGADAIELNVYFVATNPLETGAEVEERYVRILEGVKASVSIPVAMKLSPFFSSMSNMASRLDRSGADGLVLFNRFYQPDIDLDALEVHPNLVLSTPGSMRLPLRWIAILDGHVEASLAASGGVHSGTDALKMVMAGADVTMVTAALLKNGLGHFKVMHDEMVRWMEEHEYESIRQMKGSMSQKSCPDPMAFERGNYMRALQSYDASGSRIA